MKVTMKRYEKLAVDFAKKYAAGWDYFVVAVGAFMVGYEWAREDCAEGDEYPGEEAVTVEMTDGEHQLSNASFEKWRTK